MALQAQQVEQARPPRVPLRHTASRADCFPRLRLAGMSAYRRQARFPFWRRADVPCGWRPALSRERKWNDCGVPDQIGSPHPRPPHVVTMRRPSRKHRAQPFCLQTPPARSAALQTVRGAKDFIQTILRPLGARFGRIKRRTTRTRKPWSRAFPAIRQLLLRRSPAWRRRARGPALACASGWEFRLDQEFAMRLR
jgi:hypothetical protein